MEDDLSLMQSKNSESMQPQALWRQNHELIRDTGVSLYDLLSYCMTYICKYGTGGCWRPHEIVFSSQAAPLPGIWLPWYYMLGAGVGIEGGVSKATVVFTKVP